MGRIPSYKQGFLVRDGKALVETFATFGESGFSQLAAARCMGITQACVRHRLELLTKAGDRWNVGRRRAM